MASSASAEGGLESLGYVALVLGILGLAYTYGLTQTKNGLEASIKRDKAVLRKLREEIKETKKDLEIHKSEVDDRVSAEVEKVQDMSKVNHDDGLDREYWDRIGQMELPAQEKSKLEKLADEKTELERMIELTKEKYHTRVIDEKSFSDITGEYQKKLIEVEAKIRKAKGEGDVR